MAQENEVIIKLSADVAEVLSGVKAIQKASEKAAKDAQKSFDGVGKNIAGTFNAIKLGIAGLVGSKVFSGIKSGIDAVVDAGIEGEKATQRFRAALALAGDASDETALRFKNFANSISAISAVDDAVIQGQVAYAKNLGLTNEQTEKSIQAAVDLSAATGVDLDRAVQAVSKSYLGVNGALEKIVPATKNFTDAQVKAGAAVDFVSQRFAGASQGFINTLPGAIKAASLSIDQFVGSIGKALLANPEFVISIRKIAAIFQSLKESIEANGPVVSDITTGFIKSFSSVVEITVSLVTKLIQAFQTLVGIADIILDSISTDLIRIVNLIKGAFEALVSFDLSPLRDANAANKLLEDQLTESTEKRKASIKETNEFLSELNRRAQEAAKSVKGIEVSKNVKINATATLKNITVDEKELDKLKVQLTGLFSKIATPLEKAKATLAEDLRILDEALRAKLITEQSYADASIRLQQKTGDEIFNIAKSGSGGITEGFRILFDNAESSANQAAAAFGLASQGIAAIARGGEGAVDAIKGLFSAALGIAKGLVEEIKNIPIVGAFAGIVIELIEILAQPVADFEKMILSFFEALPDIIINVILNALRSGKLIREGVRRLVLGIIEALPELIRGIFAALAEAMDGTFWITLLIDAVKAFIRILPELFDAIIDGIIDLIVAVLKNTIIGIWIQIILLFKDIIVKIVKIIWEAVKGWVKAIANAAVDFVKKIIDGAKEFVKVLLDKVKSFFVGSGGGAGGGGGGIIGGAVGAVRSVAKKIGFAEGGIVPEGFPNDTFPARLTSGEFVIDRSQNKQLQGFLDSVGVGGLTKGGDEDGKPQILTVNLIVGEEQLASAILNLNRQGFRVA